MPSDDEFQSLIRGTPVFDMGSISASVSRPTIALMFGTQFAEKRLARRLYRQLGEPIYQALNIYSRVLKEWVRLVTSHLNRRFETYAERYRAQAERSLGGTGLTADEANAIEANLRILDSPETDDFVEASKQAPQNELNAITREIVNRADTGESR
jgi:hypothetical protein